MKPTGLRRLGCDMLTAGAVLSFLLWLLAATLFVQSYWCADHIAIRRGYHWSDYSFARGKLYVRAFTYSPESIDPFDYDQDWSFETSPSPVRLVENMRRHRQQFGSQPWGFLGFQTARGAARTTGGKVWRRFAEAPLWPVLAVFALLPGCWLWRRRKWSAPQRRRATRTGLVTASIPVVPPMVLLVLLFINFRFLGPREAPLAGWTSHASVPLAADANGLVLKVMTYNIRMGGAYRGGWRFEEPDRVAERIDKIARLIRQQQPDLVFLQEVVLDSGPGSFHQTPVLAEKTGMHMWVFGQCVNDGLPFYRMIDGNAILSRWPVKPLTNQKMPGDKAFYEIAADDQSTLWCTTDIAGQEILLASVHLTSGDVDPGPQVEAILEFAESRPAILAGDFNLDPNESELQPLLEAGQFAVTLDGPHTIYSFDLRRVIDYIFVPREWQLLEHQVIATKLSDHLPVVATYRIPLGGRVDENEP